MRRRSGNSAARTTIAGPKSTAPEFAEAYENSISRQRALLAEATVHERRFMAALTVTNPAFACRAETHGPTAPRRNKRARHVETTLYRYLARAVWRTEPCDLWAGAAIATWGEETRIEGALPHYAFAPDLRPFIAIFRRLAEKSHYRRTGHFTLNPTLERDEERAGWHYTARFEGAIFEGGWDSSPAIDALFGALGGLKAAPLADLAVSLKGMGFSSDQLSAMLAALVDAGVLVGGLTFPMRFSSAWSALRIAAGQLAADDATSWRQATGALKRLCRRFERMFDDMSAAEVAEAMRDASGIILSLAGRLGVKPPQMPRAPLRCDARLPFAITLGARDRRRLEEAVGEHDRFESHHGVDTASRAVHRNAMLRDPLAPPSMPICPPGDLLTLERVSAACGDALLCERIAKWSLWLVHSDGRVEMEDSHPDPGLPLPPLGGLLLRPGAAADVIVGNTTEVGAFYGRYWPLWASTADRRDARRLHRWYCDALARVSEPAGISIIEYVGPCDDAPNALAHPDFGHDVWDRWQPAATDNRHFDIDPLSSPALARDRATGKGRFAVFYDPPWTIPFLRRNEVAVPVSGG